MPEDSVTAKVSVHETSLASAALVEDAFLRQGQGSAFVSRPNELVVLSLTTAGVGAIHNKAVQLVERGFHSILVSGKGLPKLETDGVKMLLKARRYVENWAGFLRVCEVPRESTGLLRTLGFEQDLDPASPREAAVDFCRKVMSGEAGPATGATATSGDLLSSAVLESGDEITPVVAPPGTTPVAGPTNGAGSLPTVEVAELVVPAEDLPKLRRQLEGVLARGKKYVTMRLSFKKRMRSEDVTLLTDARDMLAAAGGQLALASLQQDVATWLRMLDYDREFLIFDDVDAAETAHRKHAAGKGSAPQAAAAAKPPVAEAPYAIVRREGASVFVRPRATAGKSDVSRAKAAVDVIELGRATLPSLVAEVERLTSAGSRDILVDVKPFEGLRGERLESFAEADALARIKGARLQFSRVGRELRAYLKLVGLEGKLPLCEDEDAAILALAQARHATGAFDELELALSRAPVRPSSQAPDLSATKTDRLPAFSAPRADSSSELKIDAGAIELAPAAPEEQPLSLDEVNLRFDLQKAQADRDRFSTELAQARARLQDAESARLKLERKVSDLEAAARRAEGKLQDSSAAAAQKADLEAKLADAKKRADAATAEAQGTRAEVERLKGELERSRAQLEAADKAVAAKSDAGSAQVIELLEARLREAEYSRNEANKIAQSANEARKRLDSQVEQLEAAAKTARSSGEAEAKLHEQEAARKRLEDYVKEVKAERDEASSRASELERLQEELHEKVAKLEAAARGASASKDLEAKLQAAEKRAQEAERRAETAEKRAAEGANPAASGSDAGASETVKRLEREKAEILLESKREIERLTREQDVLREELESAGEMIERLGKELELT